MCVAEPRAQLEPLAAGHLHQQRTHAAGVFAFARQVAYHTGFGVFMGLDLDEVIAAAVEQERLEGWIMSQIEADIPLPGLYPPNDETKARYEAWASTVR